MKRVTSVSITLLFALGILIGANGSVSESKTEAMQFPVPCTYCPPDCSSAEVVKPDDVCVYCAKTVNGNLVYDRYKGRGVTSQPARKMPNALRLRV